MLTDGAYYYVWTHWLPEDRPWPAEARRRHACGCSSPSPPVAPPQVGMVLIENLWAAGVPIAYMQLDDW